VDHVRLPPPHGGGELAEPAQVSSQLDRSRDLDRDHLGRQLIGAMRQWSADGDVVAGSRESLTEVANVPEGAPGVGAQDEQDPRHRDAI
jgi:hypothetical protein